MQTVEINRNFIRKLTKNIRNAYGNTVPSTEVLELVSDVFGVKAGPLMHAFKQAETDTKPIAVQPAPSVRTLPQDTPASLADLGSLLPADIERLASLADGRTGIVVISGPTGSGKTLLAMSLLRELVMRSSKTGIGIGDPIEYPRYTGKHGDGLLIQQFVPRGRWLRETVTAMSVYGPAYFHAGEIRTDRLDILDVIEASRKMLVIVTCHSGSSEFALDEFAAAFSSSAPISRAEARQTIERAVTAMVATKRTGTRQNVVFAADVAFKAGRPV